MLLTFFTYWKWRWQPVHLVHAATIITLIQLSPVSDAGQSPSSVTNGYFTLLQTFEVLPVFQCGQLPSRIYSVQLWGSWFPLKATLTIRERGRGKRAVQVKWCTCKNTKQFRGSPGKALAPFSSKNIATFVSKQNNKTSQPVVVNFLLASIDSMGFFLSLGDSSS